MLQPFFSIYDHAKTVFEKKNGKHIFIATPEPKWSKPEVAVIFYYL